MAAGTSSTWGRPSMNSVLPQPIKKIRAIVFSCHNPRYYENSIEPKLERYHIEVVKKIDPNKHSTLDLKDCDVVILLLELMPSHHVALIRRQAKTQGKEIVTLHRQVSDWERAFARKEDQCVAGAVKPISTRHATEPRIPARVAPPPAPSRAMPPPATPSPLAMWGKESPSGTMSVAANALESVEETISAEYAEWLGLLEEENKQLNEKNRDLEAKWKRASDEHEGLVTQNVTLDGKNKELMTRVRTAETAVDDLRREANMIKASHKKELDEMRDLLSKAGRELEKTGKAVLSDIEKALQHFEQLWKMGVMDAEEIITKLFKTKK